MRSDSYPHEWGACRRPVIPAREKTGNQDTLDRRRIRRVF